MAAYLLGRKAALLLGKGESESVALKDIQAATGLPKGTVGPKVRELLDARPVAQTDSGEYYVGAQQISAVIDELRKGATK